MSYRQMTKRVAAPSLRNMTALAVSDLVMLLPDDELNKLSVRCHNLQKSRYIVKLRNQLGEAESITYGE